MALPVILGHLSAALSGTEECSLGTGFLGAPPVQILHRSISLEQ